MTTYQQRMSNKHEDEVAAAFEGDVTPMSGAGWIRKGDIHTPIELVECKATEAKSYSLTLKLVEEVERLGLLAGKRGVLNVKLQPLGVRPRRFVVIPEEDYLELSSKAGERSW